MRLLGVAKSLLWSLVVLCVALRLAAWLVTPILPWLVVLFGLASAMHLVFFGRR